MFKYTDNPNHPHVVRHARIIFWAGVSELLVVWLAPAAVVAAVIMILVTLTAWRDLHRERDRLSVDLFGIGRTYCLMSFGLNVLLLIIQLILAVIWPLVRES